MNCPSWWLEEPMKCQPGRVEITGQTWQQHLMPIPKNGIHANTNIEYK